MAKRDSRTANIARQVSSKWGCSLRYVYMVMSGDRNNEGILNDCMELWEVAKVTEEKYKRGELAELADQLIPFEH